MLKNVGKSIAFLNVKDKYILLLFVCNLCVSSIAVEPEDYKPLFKCSKKLDKPYGICSHINGRGEKGEFSSRNQDIIMIDSCGVDFIRTNIWLEECVLKDSSLNFEKYDQMMSSVKEGKKNVLLIMSMLDPRRMYECATVFPQILKRYKEVNYWEIINEADLVKRRVPEFNASCYMQTLKACAQIIKMTSRKAKILYTGVPATEPIDDQFTDSTFFMGAAQYFDIMNIHEYTNLREPETMFKYFSKVNDLMNKYLVHKPVWLTETGYPTKGKSSVDEEVQAKRLPRTFLISFACGIDKVFWYKSRASEVSFNDREDHFGLWHKDYSPKPAFFAYKTLVIMCPDKSMRPRLRKDGDLYMASWKRPDGKNVWALWVSENTIKVNLKITKGYTAYNLYGQKLSITPKDFEISPSIIYIVGAKDVQIEKTN